jgi:hypothetical protein
MQLTPSAVNGAIDSTGRPPHSSMEKPESRRPSGESEAILEDAQRNTHRIAANGATPSPIRTLPSAPESHRIMLVGSPRARGLYRRSGLDRHNARSHPNPEGCASDSVVMASKMRKRDGDRGCGAWVRRPATPTGRAGDEKGAFLWGWEVEFLTPLTFFARCFAPSTSLGEEVNTSLLLSSTVATGSASGWPVPDPLKGVKRVKGVKISAPGHASPSSRAGTIANASLRSPTCAH